LVVIQHLRSVGEPAEGSLPHPNFLIHPPCALSAAFFLSPSFSFFHPRGGKREGGEKKKTRHPPLFFFQPQTKPKPTEPSDTNQNDKLERQLLTMDLLARASMKNAASCDT
jgi:hypothetical protein